MESTNVAEATIVETPDSAPGEEKEQIKQAEPDAEQNDATEKITEQSEGAEPSGAERRIKQLLSRQKSEEESRRRAEQEAAYWRGKAEGAAANTPNAPNTAPVVKPLTVPKIENFDDYEQYEKAKESYILALAEAKVQEQISNHNAKMEEERQRKAAELTEAEIEKKFRSKVASDPDNSELERIMSDQTLPVTKAMSRLIKSSDVAPELMRHLDANRELTAKIAAMPPLMAARELGRLEYRFQDKPKPPAPKRVSQAPEPIQTVKPTGSPSVPDDELPIEEFIRRRNKEQFKRR